MPDFLCILLYNINYLNLFYYLDKFYLLNFASIFKFVSSIYLFTLLISDFFLKLYIDLLNIILKKLLQLNIQLYQEFCLITI